MSLVLHCSRYSGAINSTGNLLQAQTHGYVLYVVTIHYEGIIHNCYSLTCLMLRVIYCQSCKARLAHTKQEKPTIALTNQDYYVMTFDPRILCL